MRIDYQNVQLTPRTSREWRAGNAIVREKVEQVAQQLASAGQPVRVWDASGGIVLEVKPLRA